MPIWYLHLIWILSDSSHLPSSIFSRSLLSLLQPSSPPLWMETLQSGDGSGARRCWYALMNISIDNPYRLSRLQIHPLHLELLNLLPFCCMAKKLKGVAEEGHQSWGDATCLLLCHERSDLITSFACLQGGAQALPVQSFGRHWTKWFWIHFYHRSFWCRGLIVEVPSFYKSLVFLDIMNLYFVRLLLYVVFWGYEVLLHTLLRQGRAQASRSCFPWLQRSKQSWSHEWGPLRPQPGT